MLALWALGLTTAQRNQPRTLNFSISKKYTPQLEGEAAVNQWRTRRTGLTASLRRRNGRQVLPRPPLYLKPSFPNFVQARIQRPSLLLDQGGRTNKALALTMYATFVAFLGFSNGFLGQGETAPCPPRGPPPRGGPSHCRRRRWTSRRTSFTS